jgi:hypothetical protein
MPQYEQGYSDRKDESLGMRDGKESGKSQSYKSRRDESYGMKGKKIMGHEKNPSKCNVFSSQRRDLGRVQERPRTMRGNPEQAYGYKY